MATYQIESIGGDVLQHHARSINGQHEATQLRNGRWVAGRAYGDCRDCTSRGAAASGHTVDPSTPTYSAAAEALEAAEREYAES